jgi:alpha-glucosidase (family GH31 glycosyl hydrolase)
LNNEDVREWWGQQYEDLFAMGLEFVWQDMTTPAIHESFGDMKGYIALGFPPQFINHEAIDTNNNW